MIIYKKETRELIIPNGLGNLNGLSDDAMGAIVDAAEADGAAEQKSKMETLNVTENGVYEREDGYNRVEVNVEGGGEGGGCNLEDKWVTPSMGEMDDNGYIVVEEDEGYDGLARVVINPSTIYNEGIEEGRNQGGGSGDCNLEDKWVTPSMDERDDNGLIVVYPSEGFDGMRRTVIDPQTIYDEGREAGGGGGCNLGEYNEENQDEEVIYREASWYGLDGFGRINIDCKPFAENKREEGKQIVQNNLKDLNITVSSFGERVYEASMEDVNVECLYFNNGQRFLSNYTPFLNTSEVENNGFEIIVKAKLINGEDNGGILIGTALVNDFESDTMSAIILRTNIDATRLYLGQGWTNNAPTRLNEWVTYRITLDGLYISSESNPNEELIGWEVEPNINNNTWDTKVAIGGLNTFYDGLSSDYRYSGKIAKVEFKQAETYTYVPTESGLFLQTETSSELQPVDGEPAVYTNDTEKVGEYGWKTVTVRKSYSEAVEGLDLWYFYITGIGDENDAFNERWQRYLRSDNGDTLKDVFVGRQDIMGSDAVAKPYFISAVSSDNTVTKIGKLVYSTSNYYEPKGCGVTIIGAFDCRNIQEVDLEAFKYMTDLVYMGGMNGLGESFTSPQTIDFTYCSRLFSESYPEVFMSEFAEGLFDLSSGNQYGVNNSTLRFNNVVQEKSRNAEAIAIIQNKGWTIEFV